MASESKRRKSSCYYKKTKDKDFEIKIGLTVDKSKSGASGTSNDGNTARRFFDNAVLSSEITGINVALIISRF